MPHIDGLALSGYALGRDPIDLAIDVAAVHIEITQAVAAGRAENPAQFPGVAWEPTVPSLARRIVGALLDAGWTPPTQQDIAAARAALQGDNHE